MEQLLQDLIAIPTVTSDNRAIRQALDYVERYLRVQGMPHVERLTHNGFESLIATTQRTKQPTVLLGAHIDVVPATTSMFTMTQDQAKYYGRGVLDMKCAIAAYLQTIKGLRPKLTEHNFGLMITADEEVGGRDGVGRLVELGYRPQICVLPDGGDNWQIQTRTKGFLGVSLIARGRAAHGSRPWLGDNAIGKLLPAISDIQRLFPHSDATASTLNIGKLAGGETWNRVPDYAEALLDIRLAAENERQPMLSHLQAICKRRAIDLHVDIDGASCDFSLQHPLIAPFVDDIQEVTGVTVRGSHTLGSNDSRYFAAVGVPCISFYPPGGGHHGPEEWVSIEGVRQMQVIIERYVQRLC